MAPTPTARLAEMLLGDAGPLEAFIRTRRAKGQSWRQIERALSRATGDEVAVTHETIRSWFPDDGPADVAS